MSHRNFSFLLEVVEEGKNNAPQVRTKAPFIDTRGRTKIFLASFADPAFATPSRFHDGVDVRRGGFARTQQFDFLPPFIQAPFSKVHSVHRSVP
uniref:Uncharacterized protein n=1 Tax=Dechloromonas aromatica (strain RCB) TaxID=159087 RepID=Q47ES7_DECAR